MPNAQPRLPLITRSWFWVVILLLHCLFMALVLFLAYQQALPRFFNLPLYDKAGHFYLLGMLAYLTHRATNRWTLKVGTLTLPFAPLLVMLFATLEEGLQTLSPYRTFSILDWLLSCAGIWAFWGLDVKIVKAQTLK